MKVLLIGYGSIGRRHDEVLSSFAKINETHIVTKQTLADRVTFSALENVGNIQSYDYFLIASETKKHYEQLCWLNEQVSGKKIFCEKPLFEKHYDLPPMNNQIYIGYVLRFHPILQKMKSLLDGQEVLTANIACGSYLPSWRTNIDYRDSYSAKKAEGGGVLLDLSHELDYAAWLVGSLQEVKSYQAKVSDLEIDSDDLVSLVGKTDQKAIINLVMDYFSPSAHRLIRINTNTFTLEADLIKNELIQTHVNGEKDVFAFQRLQRNDMFQAMHHEILFNEQKNFVCTLGQGLSIMQTINTIQEQNNE
ncbi:Gfo/Idh/MocA family protein [Thiothrix nivea]|uniref:Oxidoreductase family protein n=1 Tax=Thiothrix nivea (strain ATCC 35100 / DSM 5205 / JP2) TaxID=870187 RepID=A0A656HGQ4_THINJ|nr:Gfo/Idh/MocA family oxidoreductase [Thiothrix nivea]EIJ34215.1 oxidoreductase family protein [Thiothrix nivea DSM 5205]